MKQFILMTLFSLVAAITLSPRMIEADIPPKQLTVRETIVLYAQIFAVPEKRLVQIATCESTINPNAYNPKDVDGRPKYGLFQFDSRTFAKYAKKSGVLNPDIWNVDQQAYVTAYMFSIGEGKQWGCF